MDTVTSHRDLRPPCRISSFSCRLRPRPLAPTPANCNFKQNGSCCCKMQLGLTGSPCTPIARVQDKTQYFPQDPSQQPFPPYSTDPKVTASVQVPLKVEVERRKRLFANQDIMYAPNPVGLPRLAVVFVCLADACDYWATGISCMLKA